MDAETSRALVIYDTTGKVIATYFGADTDDAPEGIPYTWVDIPENAILSKIDIETGLPVFDYLPDSIMGVMQNRLNKIETRTEEQVSQMINDLGNTNGAVNENSVDILDVQMAVAELYEMLIGGEEA